MKPSHFNNDQDKQEVIKHCYNVWEKNLHSIAKPPKNGVHLFDLNSSQSGEEKAALDAWMAFELPLAGDCMLLSAIDLMNNIVLSFIVCSQGCMGEYKYLYTPRLFSVIAHT